MCKILLAALLAVAGCASTSVPARAQSDGPLYIRNNLGEIASNGSGAQALARTNLGLAPISTLLLGTGLSTDGVTLFSAGGGSSINVPAAALLSGDGAALHGVTVSTGLAMNSALLSVQYGTVSGTAAQGNDSRITGAQQVSGKGAANGYAGLDSNGLVPVSSLPLGTTNGTVAAGNDGRIAGALQASAIPTAQLLGGTGSALAPVAIGNTLNLTAGVLNANALSVPSAPLLSGNGTAFGAATSSGITTVLGYVPLNPANNGSEFSNKPTVRANLGIGSIATLSIPGVSSLLGSSGADFTPVAVGTGLTYAANSLAVVYGAGAGTAAQGNDTRFAAAEQTVNKGAPGGYAPLNGSGFVPVGDLPIGTGPNTVAAGNDSRITGAEQFANRGAANGYAPLNSSSVVPVANLPLGTGAGTVAAGNDTRIATAEQLANKGSAGGYAPLNGASQVPVANIPLGTTALTVAVGNDSRFATAEQQANKGAPSGYAPLNGSSQVPIANIPTGTNGATVALGNDSRFLSAEQTTNKGSANGYAPLNSSAQVPSANLPIGTAAGTVAAGNDSRLTGATTLATVAATYAPINSPALTGTPTTPTPSGTIADQTIVNAAWVKSLGYATGAGNVYQGTWDPTTNTPTLTSGTSSYGAGGYFIVVRAGTFTLDSITTEAVGDQIIYSGSTNHWTKIPAVFPVTSVAGKNGAVTLVVGDISGAAATASLGPLATAAAAPNLRIVGFNSSGLPVGVTLAPGDLPVASSAQLGAVRPDGTTINVSGGAISVAYGTASNTAAQGNDSRFAAAEQTANKGALGGYAPLNGSGVVPAANLPIGTATGTVAAGNDGRFASAEQTANKNAASGYAGLNSSSQIAFAQIPTGTSSTSVAVGNDSRITGAEQVANKGAASGYAPLNSSSLVPIGNLPVGSSASTVAAGNDTRISGAEQTANKNATGGYAGLSGGKLASGQLPFASYGTVGGATAASAITNGLLVDPTSGTFSLNNVAVWTQIQSAYTSLPNAPGAAGEFWNNGILCRVPGTLVVVGTTNPFQSYLNAVFGGLPTTSSTPGAWINNAGGGCYTRVPGTYAGGSTTTQDLFASLSYMPTTPTRPLALWNDGGIALVPIVATGGSGGSASAVGVANSFQTTDGSANFTSVPDFFGAITVNHATGNTTINPNLSLTSLAVSGAITAGSISPAIVNFQPAVLTAGSTTIVLTATSPTLEMITLTANGTLKLPASPTVGLGYTIHNSTLVTNGYTLTVQNSAGTAQGNPISPSLTMQFVYDGTLWQPI